MAKDRRLGRGLAALLGSSLEDETFGADASGSPLDHAPADAAGKSGAVSGGALIQLNVYEIDDNPFQPRRDFNEREIAELAESLKTHDMLQPILVRQHGSRYQLISGERRLRAAILAGWKTVPVRVREADDRLLAELAIVENLQRKDLNAVEKALSFKRYLEDHGCTQEELAGRLKIDRSHISNLVRLLELPPPVVDAVREGKLTAGHAKALLPLGEETTQITLARRCMEEDMSVRELEQFVQIELALDESGRQTISSPQIVSKHASPKVKNKRSEHLASLEQELRRALGVRVEIIARSNEKGKIVIHYASQNEFSQVREVISGIKSTRAAA